MWITSKAALAAFSEKHPEAKDRLSAWYKVIEACGANNFTELKSTFNTADYVPAKYTIFDVGGNAYRIVTVIHYDKQRLFIRAIYTHAEYDKWTRQNRGK